MGNISSFFYEQLFNILNQEKVDFSSLSKKEINELLTISQSHGFELLLYETFKHSDTNMFDEIIMTNWKALYLRKTFEQQLKFKMAEKLYESFNEKGVQVMLLKGIAYSRYYVNPFLRTMSDLDLYVNEDEVIKVGRILEGFGYVSTTNLNSNHIVYEHPESIIIELHHKLVDENTFPEMSQIKDDIFIGSSMIDYKGIKFISPKAEYELLFCLVHMYKHYYQVSIGFKHVSDVYVIINNNDLDWIYITQKLKQYKIMNFSMSIFLLLEMHLQVKFPKIIKDELMNIDSTVMELLKDDIYASGGFGFYDKSIYLSNHIADYHFDTKGKKTKFSMYIKYIFPDYKYISSYMTFHYVKKFKPLIIFAWVHRILLHLKKGTLKKDYIDQVQIKKRLILKNWIKD